MFKSKKTITIALSLLALSLTSLSSTDAEATRKSAINTAVKAATELEVLYGIDVYENGVTGLLRPGQSTFLPAQLIKGTTYIFVAGGCTDAHDVDLIVYDSDLDVVTVDTSLKRSATSAFQAPYTGVYFLQVRMARSTPNGAHWVVVTGEG